MKTSFKKRWYLFIPLIIAAFIAFGFITMWLWNWLMPAIFHLPVISFWQTVGLLILSRLLLGGLGHGGGHHGWKRNMRQKWDNMTPEEREKFRQHMHQHGHVWFNRCAGEGKASE